MQRGKFGKLLLIFELLVVAGTTIGGYILAWLCIRSGYAGSLPWIAASIAPAWVAYGASKATYNNKTQKESQPYCEAEAASIRRDA